MYRDVFGRISQINPINHWAFKVLNQDTEHRDLGASQIELDVHQFLIWTRSGKVLNLSELGSGIKKRQGEQENLFPQDYKLFHSQVITMK